MLYTVYFVVHIFVLFCFAFLAISHVIISGSSEDERDRDMQTEEKLLSWQWIISVHDQKGTVASRFSLYVDHRRVTFSRGADARQSVLSSKCFELVSDRQTV